MPAALAVDREAVKTLVHAHGVREAARRIGIRESTVQQWSARFKWLAKPILPPTMTPTEPTLAPNASVTAVTTPSEAMRNSLEDSSKATRIGLATASRKVAEHLSNATPDQIMDRHKAMHSVTQVASKVHGWDSDKAGSNAINLNLAIQVNAGPAESQD